MIMKIYKLSTLVVTLALLCTACNNDTKEFFEDERHIKMIYAVTDDSNIFHAEYDMSNSEEFVARNLSFAVSGSNPVDKNVTIEIAEKPELIDRYNQANYMDDTDRYIKPLPDNSYEIPSKTITIEAGKNPNAEYALLSVKLRREVLYDLSPDSIYFLPFTIREASPYPVIENRRDVLFRIYKKNLYAESRKASYYISRGYQGTGQFSGVQKRIFPITGNASRFTVGNESYKATDTEEEIIKKSMLVTVNAGNSVNISAYEGGVLVEQLIPSANPTEASYYFNNTYDEETKTFYLYYQFSKDGGNTYTVIMEELVRDAV